MAARALSGSGLASRNTEIQAFRPELMSELDTELTSQILASFRNKILSGTAMCSNMKKLNTFEDTRLSSEEPGTDSGISQSPIHLKPSKALPSTTYHQLVPVPCSMQKSPESAHGLSLSWESSDTSLSSSQMSPDDSQQSCVAELTQPTVDLALPCSDVAPLKSHHMLPPCRVCGEKASGFHYGANTCEACKGFFRRSLKKNDVEYKCNGGKQCIIQKGRRNNCPLCRYNKCLSIGMSKQAIKTGRYTHEKRTKDIVEVKQLNGDHIPPMSRPCSVADPASGHGSPASVLLSEENEALVKKIFSAHTMLFPFWHKVINSGQLPAIMKKFSDEYQLKKSLFGTSQNISKEEYRQFYDVTGVDVDNRASTIETITQHLELSIMTFVRFAKSVPGFCDLPLNDQASLVKLSRFEIWMIGAHKFMNHELQVLTGPRGKAFHMEELSLVMDKDFVQSMFEFAKSLQMITLSSEETALLKTVVLMFSDRSELQEPGKVEAIQLQLISCLESLLNSGRRFSQVMNVLVKLRDLTEWHTTISENLILDWPTIKHNPLLLEIMST